MSNEPKIIIEDWQGLHNRDIQKSRNIILKGNTYKDLSTICIIPIRGVIPQNGGTPIGVIPARVVQSWMSMLLPMNQKFIRLFITDSEVGDAYNQAINFILKNEELSKWKYILTMEEDNMPPPDGLLKLYEAINTPPGYDVVQGLYWTKGEGGQPMIYGNPDQFPLNFIPQLPRPDTIQRCNGLGMGYNLFKLDIFKDPKLPNPFFKTLQEFKPGIGAICMTQDLYFFENAGKLGYKFAVDTRVKVGHYQLETDIVW